MSESVPVSEKIRRARRAKDLTQEGLDDALGVPHGRTFAYEKGRAAVPEVIVRRIARVLDVMPDWFFDGEDTPPPFGQPPAPSDSARSLIPNGTSASPIGERGMVATAGPGEPMTPVYNASAGHPAYNFSEKSPCQTADFPKTLL